MNFANVAKMNVPTKPSHYEPIVITMDNSSSSSPSPDLKIAPGYRGPSSAGTTPIHHQKKIIRTTNFDSLSPTSQLCRAPGANRHQQSISPSMNKVILDQNGQTGSSTTSSTSSSPLSIKQQTNQFIQPQQLFTSLDQQQQKPFGPIGSHRTQIPTTADVRYNENPLQMRTKFNRTLLANNTPMYQQAPPPPLTQSMMLNNPAYANMLRSRSNRNPSAPEFQHGNRLPPPPFIPPPSPSPSQAPISNGPLSANIMNIARMMEQKQQQQLYITNTNIPIYPPMPPPPPPVVPPQIPPPPHPLQQADMQAMQQHVQNQVLRFWRLHINQQHLVPSPSQFSTTLQIANILVSKGQLPQDQNQAAAIVAAYYYTNFISRTQ